MGGMLPSHLWYVSYGSNMSRRRLGCYIAGGTPPGSTRTYAGARDRTLPTADHAVSLPGSLYFAGESQTWGGGVAFYDHDSPGETAGRAYLPAGDFVFRAFAEPLSEVKVLIVGQDPYPTPGHAIGLSFAVDPEVRPLPRSLGNIYKELESDLGIPPAQHGDLRAWSRQGVMLLNRALTVSPGEPASHRGKGWEEITERAITALIERDQALVAILWGRDARNLAPLLTSGTAEVAIIESAHPSPLSARRGFFGSRPFSRTNELLGQKGIPGIDWQLPPQS